MSKPISSMMAEQAISVDMDATMEQVEEALRASDLSAVPVIDSANRSVLGLISARDLVRFHGDKKNAAAVRAWEICTYKPVEASPDTPVSEVAALMVARGVHHVVITENNEIRGIVSALDFVKQFISEPA
ncbi:MAG TPA: CBS domain-containing protein [Telluria sp.]|nr:CBS domain-containing protein [Telluria sp.]